MAVAITQTANPAGVAATATVATYSSVSIGTAASDRIVAVVVATELASSTPSVVTIDSGGGALTMAAATTGNFTAMFARVFYTLVPTGTTATITVKFSAVSPGSTANHIAVYAVTGASGVLSAQGGDGSTDMDATDPLTTGSVTVPTDGGFLAVACGATDTVAKTWANATEDLDVDAGTFRFTTATRTTSGTVTITCTGATNGEDGALSYVIFAPGTLSLTESIVSYYTLDESSGNAADSVGSNTLTNTNTVTYAAALINNGGDFGTANTTKKFINTGLYQTGSFTVTGWFRLNTEIAAGQYGIFQMSDNTTGLRSILLTYDYNAGTRRVTADYHKNNTSDGNVIYSSGSLGTSAWSHFAVTYNGVTFTLYVNGSLQGTPLAISGGGSGSSGTQGFTLGLADRYAGSYASVDIDEVGMWSRGLFHSEVVSLYNSGTGLQYPFTPPASDTSYIASMARMVQAGVGF